MTNKNLSLNTSRVYTILLNFTDTLRARNDVAVTLFASSSCSDYKFLLQLFFSAGNRGQRNGYLGKQEQRFIPL